MKLYHVTRNINQIDIFTPKVPKYLEQYEIATPRICLSDSIEGCLSGIFFHWFDQKFYNTYCGRGCFKYKFHPFSELLIYEFDSTNISSSNLLTPKEVFNYFKVYDALLNKEYCVINESITPLKVTLVNLKSTYIQLKNDKINDKLYKTYKFKDLKYTKINSLEDYIKKIPIHYYNKISYSYKSDIIDDLNFQIRSREAQTPVKNIFEQLLLEIQSSNQFL